MKTLDWEGDLAGYYITAKYALDTSGSPIDLATYPYVEEFEAYLDDGSPAPLSEKDSNRIRSAIEQRIYDEIKGNV